MKKSNLIYALFTIVIVIVTVIMIISGSEIDKTDSFPWYFEKLNLIKSQQKHKGNKKIKVAFLDTGLNYEVIPFMKNEIVDGYNCITETNDFNDNNGHGTSVIALSSFDSDKIQYSGIYSDIIIVPVVVADASGKTNEDYIYKGIIYAIENNVDIINISLGSKKTSEKVETALYYAFCKNILVICSTGDYRDTAISYPASSEYTIPIASQSILGVPYLNANYNSTCLLIPGENISILKWNEYDSKFDVGIGNGSSYACAIFTGIVAMYLSNENNNIELIRSEIKKQIDNQKSENCFINVYSFIL